MGTTLTAINAALKEANIDAKLVKVYASKHEFVGPDAPKLNPVVAYRALGEMTPDEWVALFRERASEQVPDLSTDPALQSWKQRRDIDMTGAFADWGHTVRTNGKLKREFQQRIASLCQVEPERLLLMRPSFHKPASDKSGQGDTHTGTLYWFLSFIYHPEAVDVLRSLPTRFFSTHTKEWAVPVEDTESLITKIGPYFGIIVDTAAETVFSNGNPKDLRRSIFDLLPRLQTH